MGVSDDCGLHRVKKKQSICYGVERTEREQHARENFEELNHRGPLWPQWQSAPSLRPTHECPPDTDTLLYSGSVAVCTVKSRQYKRRVI